MLEIPESKTLETQAVGTLLGKTIKKVVNAASPHKFAFYNGAAEYGGLLCGRTIDNCVGHGAFLDLNMDADTSLTFGDGTNIRYYMPYEKHPEKHQLLLVFEDDSFLVVTVAMYGMIYAYRGDWDNKYYQGSINSVSPLSDAFDEKYFERLIGGLKNDASAKALLATEQRIPGLGNGVLQDILFNAGMHPKRKVSTWSDFEKGELFHSLKHTLNSMADKGGRDTEKDLFGNLGGYKTLLSKNTYKAPCPHCGDAVVKESYMGGSIYYCPTCQPLAK